MASDRLDDDEKPSPYRPYTPSYLVSLCLVSVIWLPVPLSWVYVVYSLYTGRVWNYSSTRLGLFIAALVEVRQIGFYNPFICSPGSRFFSPCTSITWRERSMHLAPEAVMETYPTCKRPLLACFRRVSQTCQLMAMTKTSQAHQRNPSLPWSVMITERSTLETLSGLGLGEGLGQKFACIRYFLPALCPNPCSTFLHGRFINGSTGPCTMRLCLLAMNCPTLIGCCWMTRHYC